jgi:hypothetical protein
MAFNQDAWKEFAKNVDGKPKEEVSKMLDGTSHKSKLALLESMLLEALPAGGDTTQWLVGGKYVDSDNEKDKRENVARTAMRRATSIQCDRQIMNHYRCSTENTRDCEPARDLMNVCLKFARKSVEMQCMPYWSKVLQGTLRTGAIDEEKFQKLQTCVLTGAST